MDGSSRLNSILYENRPISWPRCIASFRSLRHARSRSLPPFMVPFGHVRVEMQGKRSVFRRAREEGGGPSIISSKPSQLNRKLQALLGDCLIGARHVDNFCTVGGYYNCCYTN